MSKLSDRQIALMVRVCSVHRASLRRKLDRLPEGSRERETVLVELEETQDLASLLADEDLNRMQII